MSLNDNLSWWLGFLGREVEGGERRGGREGVQYCHYYITPLPSHTWWYNNLGSHRMNTWRGQLKFTKNGYLLPISSSQKYETPDNCRPTKPSETTCTILTYNTYIFVKQVQVTPAGLELQGKPGSNDMACISGENLDGNSHKSAHIWNLHLTIYTSAFVNILHLIWASNLLLCFASFV